MRGVASGARPARSSGSAPRAGRALETIRSRASRRGAAVRVPRAGARGAGVDDRAPGPRPVVRPAARRRVAPAAPTALGPSGASTPGAALADALGGGGAVTKTTLNKRKVGELRAELERAGLSAEGKKPELVERVLAAIDARGEPEVSAVDASSSSSGSSSSATDSSGASDASASPAPPRQRTMFNSRPASASSASSAVSEDADSNFSGMELTFLGTSSGSPSFTRNVSSYALRLTDEIWLFDCGEATQHQLMRSHLRYSKITRIFITHMHGDHIFGLPGLICALSGSRAEQRRVHGKTPDPLYITGPPGIRDFVRAAVECSRTALGLPLVVTELTAPGDGARGAGSPDPVDPRMLRSQTHLASDGRCKMFLGERWPDNGAPEAPHFRDLDAWRDASRVLPYWTVHREFGRGGHANNPRGNPSEGGLVVRAAPLRHPVPCFGYVVDEPDQAGRMDVEKATALGLPPGRLYKKLKNGECVETPDGRVIRPEQVLGPDRPGRRLCLLGDTCDSVGVARLARGADVLVHESTFEARKRDEALFKGHSTSVMAGEFARSIAARTLLLTHFSNRYGGAFKDATETDGSGGGRDGSVGSRTSSPDDLEGDDADADSDMALPERAPDDLRAAAAEESNAVTDLVDEAARAKGDRRVVAASDFFSFNVQRRESFDACDDQKGDRRALFRGPDVSPRLEPPEAARRRIDGGGGGGYGSQRANGAANAHGYANGHHRGPVRGRGVGYRGGGDASGPAGAPRDFDRHDRRGGGGVGYRGDAYDARRQRGSSRGGPGTRGGFERGRAGAAGGGGRRAGEVEGGPIREGGAGSGARGAGRAGVFGDDGGASIDSSAFVRDFNASRE